MSTIINYDSSATNINTLRNVFKKKKNNSMGTVQCKIIYKKMSIYLKERAGTHYNTMMICNPYNIIITKKKNRKRNLKFKPFDYSTSRTKRNSKDFFFPPCCYSIF